MRNFFLLFLFIPYIAFSSAKTDSLFDQLKRELNNKNSYDANKELAIQKLKNTLKAS